MNSSIGGGASRATGLPSTGRETGHGGTVRVAACGFGTVSAVGTCACGAGPPSTGRGTGGGSTVSVGLSEAGTAPAVGACAAGVGSFMTVSSTGTKGAGQSRSNPAACAKCSEAPLAQSGRRNLASQSPPTRRTDGPFKERGVEEDSKEYRLYHGLIGVYTKILKKWRW